LNIWPPTTRIVIRKRWREFFKLRGDQEVVLIPYINARGKVKEERLMNSGENNVNDLGSESY
jgi:hypothetical protein